MDTKQPIHVVVTLPAALDREQHPIAFYAARERGRLAPRVDIIAGPFATLAEAATTLGIAPEKAAVAAGRVDGDPDPRIDGCLVGLVFA